MTDIRTQPLPSGPSNLCFIKDEFMKDEFSIDKFVVDCRKRASLETLRDDLSMYLKILQHAMIELINKDYADFVNLSTNLVGLDKAIGNLTSPLNQLRDEVTDVQGGMDEAIQAVQEKIHKQSHVREKKACLQRLISITHSVEKIEQLLGIKTSDKHVNVQYGGELTGQLIERVATEFNKLQFYVNKSRGLPLVEEIKPRIANITTTLQYSLEGSFKEGLDNGKMEVLRQCLRTYATIDKMKDAEKLFRLHVVEPHMDELISEQFIKNNPQGLRGMYNKIIEFIPRHCRKLKEVTMGGIPGSEVVRGYDFLVNAVWPEVVSNIEAKTPSIFAPGNPELFHEKYLCSIDFVEQFERQCGSQASVKRLRAHPSYNTFMSKWSLPVYFQIRFQDIAGSFETALTNPWNTAANTKIFHLHATGSLWKCIHRCWEQDVYLPAISHKFWKLTLQLLSRYASWIAEVQEDELYKSKINNGELDQTKQGGGDTNTMSRDSPITTQHVTIEQLICLLADAQTVAEKIPAFYQETVLPLMKQCGLKDDRILQEGLNDAAAAILDKLPAFGEYITEDITSQCSVHLKLVNDIPRLYRRTNRDIPSKASGYVLNLVKPINHFMESNKDTIKDKNRKEWVHSIFHNLSEQYHSVTSEVLTSVKKMEESLKRLKKAKGSSTNLAAMGMTDDDKIRQQLYLDVKEFGSQIESLGQSKEELDSFQKLFDLVNSAKKSSSSVS